MSAHCDCHHEHCRKLVKPPQPTTYPLTMENLEKGVKNINTIIDMIDTRQDENREQMMVFLKIFCDDLISKLKENNSNVNNSSNTKEPEMPINERINKTLIQLLLKPAVITTIFSMPTSPHSLTAVFTNGEGIVMITKSTFPGTSLIFA